MLLCVFIPFVKRVPAFVAKKAGEEIEWVVGEDESTESYLYLPLLSSLW